VWDVATGKNIDALRTHSILASPSALAFSPDGKTVAMGAELGGPQLWDIDQFGFRDDFNGRSKEGGRVTHLAFSPDGKTLVTAGLGLTVEFWDVPAGAPKGVRRDATPPLVPPPPGIVPAFPRRP
jgi:WD40 repeat protein